MHLGSQRQYILGVEHQVGKNNFTHTASRMCRNYTRAQQCLDLPQAICGSKGGHLVAQDPKPGDGRWRLVEHDILAVLP
jgi:hypothetical protein